MMWRLRPSIEFICHPEDFGAIAKPIPASKAVPDWYKGISNADDTLKRCVPLLDALSAGWIIPVPADIIVTVKGANVETSARYPKALVSFHSAAQLKGSPWEHQIVIKIETLWTVKTSPGWSCLYTKPMNTRSYLEPLSGVVDTDTYLGPVVVPLYLTCPDGTHAIEKGTPLVQCIPFKRSHMASSVRASTTAEQAAMVVQFNSIHSQSGWYRQFIKRRS